MPANASFAAARQVAEAGDRGRYESVMEFRAIESVAR